MEDEQSDQAESDDNGKPRVNEDSPTIASKPRSSSKNVPKCSDKSEEQPSAKRTRLTKSSPLASPVVQHNLLSDRNEGKVAPEKTYMDAFSSFPSEQVDEITLILITLYAYQYAGIFGFLIARIYFIFISSHM